jgi:hypothetical protein
MSIKAVEITFGPVPDSTDVTYFPGTDAVVPIFKLGYFAWVYDGTSPDNFRYGDLQWLNFQRQIKFAPTGQEIGFSVWPQRGLRWRGLVRYNKLDAFDTKVLGQAANLALGKLGAFRPVSNNQFIGEPPPLALPSSGSTFGAPK